MIVNIVVRVNIRLIITITIGLEVLPMTEHWSYHING